nr:3'-5' exonuclease [Clostridioides difficile]
MLKIAISYIRTSLDYDRYVLDYCSNRKIKTNGLVEILNELESSATNFNTVTEFLEHIDRVKTELTENNKNKQTEGVIFTTMHSAKGLEFRNVYIIGVNEGTIPHEKSYDICKEEKKEEQLEEERRLMYVAITRAEEKLCISSTLNKYGKKVDKSLFINDIKSPTKKEIDSIGVGDKVYHKKFHEGEIIKKDGIMFTIKFKDRERILDLKTCLLKNIIYTI